MNTKVNAVTLVSLSLATVSSFTPFWLSVLLLLVSIFGGAWCLCAVIGRKYSPANSQDH